MVSKSIVNQINNNASNVIPVDIIIIGSYSFAFNLTKFQLNCRIDTHTKKNYPNPFSFDFGYNYL